jgi:hypothetical protein
MRNFFTVSLFVMALSACGNDNLDLFEGRHGIWTPRPMYFSHLPQGGDAYSQGVRDGCNSANSTVGSAMMRTNYEDIYLDVDRTIKDSDYNRGWSMGHNYCTYFNDVDPI